MRVYNTAEKKGAPRELPGGPRRNGKSGYVQSDSIKNTLNVQIHDLRKRGIWMRIEFLSPRSPRVREQDIHMIRCLFHLRHQSFHIGYLRTVGRH